MAQTSLIIGQGNWAIKSGSLLGYNVFDDNRYGPVPMDVVRASTATRVNSSGLIKSVGINVPRVDYSNGTASLLLEPQRTNLLSYSEQFDNIYWVKSRTVITANSVISPDGTQNADIIRNTPRLGSYIQRNTVLSATSTYTLSLYVKPLSTNKYIFFEYDYGTSGVATFNLSNQTTDGIGTKQITPVGNGWFRISNTVTNVTRFSSMYIGGYGTTPNNTSFAIWGAQLEVGSYATSYIPTVASTVTRNGDVVSKTGISNLIGQTEGTIFFDGIVNNIQNSSANILNTNNATTTISSFALGKLKSNNKFLFSLLLANGTYDAIPLESTNAFANGTRTKIAIRYKSGSFAMYINGNLEATSSTSFTNIGTKTELFLNDVVTYFNYQESVSFNSVVLFTSGLTNTELAQLTTL